MQGVHATLRNAFATSVQNYIIASRMKQGQMDMYCASSAEREDVVIRWNNIKFDLKNFQAMKLKEQREKQKADNEGAAPGPSETSLSPPVTGWTHTRNLSFEERKRLHARKEAWKKGQVETLVPEMEGDIPPSKNSTADSVAEDEEFERAIRASVAETSRGNAEEDAAIEQAIRASVNHIRSSGQPLPDARPQRSVLTDDKNADIFKSSELEITDEEYQQLIEQAIQQSMSMHASGVRTGQEEHEDDEAFQRALAESRVHQAPRYEDDEELKRVLAESQMHHDEGETEEQEQLRRAIEASEAAHKDQMSRDAAARTEEDIVMEYVKKQSLAEEEFRRQSSKGKGSAVADADEDDEDLRRAMEESLRMSGGPGQSSSSR